MIMMVVYENLLADISRLLLDRKQKRNPIVIFVSLVLMIVFALELTPWYQHNVQLTV